MTTGAPGAVFFLGTRAHYQVLQPPESQYDAENGNAETIYQNPGTWRNVLDLNVKEDNGLKKRHKRRSSETTLCEDMKPSQLNNVENDNTSPKEKRRSLLTFLSSLSRRKKRLSPDQYLQHIESALTACTYRDSCRCLECQTKCKHLIYYVTSTYFDCDEDKYNLNEESEDESEYTMYIAQMNAKRDTPPVEDDDDDDEVFVDELPDDNTSTDMLLEPKKMSVSSESSEELDPMNIDVAAGTPLLVNFLMTHPITCSIQ